MATRHRLITSQLHTTHGQSAIGQWPLPSHARLEVVEESGEAENDVGDTLRQRVESARPEHSTDIPTLELTSQDRSDIGEGYDDATGVKSGGSTKQLDTVGLDDSSEGYTTISKQKSRLLKPAIPTVPYSSPSGLLSVAIILAIN